MKLYSEAEIESLIERFEAQKLPKVEWTHEAHLVVAVWYLSKHAFNEAMDLARQNITKHNTSVGTPNTDTEGYHETITRFWLLLAQNYLNSKARLSMSELCNGFIQSAQASSSFPLKHYSSEVLFSVEARHNWIEPNLNQL